MAKIPSPQVNHYRVQNFSGGLNSKTDPSLLQDNEASDLLNVVFDDKGVVQKRPGVRIYKKIGNQTNKLFHVYDFHRRDNSFERVYFEEAKSGTGEMSLAYNLPNNGFSIFIIKNDNDSALTLSFYEEDGTTEYDFTANTPNEEFDYSEREWCFFTFNDKMYFMNAIDGLFCYEGQDYEGPAIELIDYNYKIVKTPRGTPDTVDGEGNPVAGTHLDFVKPCKYAVVHKNRVFYSGFRKEADYVYFSELGNPVGVKPVIQGEYSQTADTGGGYFAIPSNDTEITGLGTFLDKLVIFKLNSAHVLSGTYPQEFDLGKINVNDGCISHKSIVLGNNFLYFLSPTGLNYLYSPDQQMIETKSLSDNIQDSLLLEDLQLSFSVFYSNKYYLFTPNFLFVYDETIKAWTKHDVRMRSAMVDKENQKLLMCHTFLESENPSDGMPYLYHFDENKLNDEYETGIEKPIRSMYQTRYFDFTEPELQKRLKFVKLFFRPTTGTGEIRLIQEINYRSQTRFVDTSYNALFWGVQNWGDGLWGASVDFLSKKVPIGGIGEYIRYTFINDKLDQEFKIFAFIVGFKRKKKVR